MRILRIAGEATHALRSNRLRTFFMMLGTVLGIAALIVVMAIGKATRRHVDKRVGAWGANIIKVNAGGGKGYTKPQAHVVTLKLDDAEAIRANFTGWDVVSAVAEKRNVSMKAGNVEWQADVFSVEPEYHDFMNWPTQEGEGIAAEDVATMARVCVLGTSLAKTLFGDESPLEKTMSIQNVRFRVKGVLSPRGMGPGGTPSDNRLLIPLTTGMRRVFNRDYVSYIRVRMVNAADVPATAERLRTFMRTRHHITPPEEDDFSVVTAAEVEEAARGISGTLTTLLMILVGLSLIVGGVVLMNILLISVAERSKEIGLRRALGATQRDIFQQFLIESLIVTFFGMVVGCALGATVGALLPRMTNMQTVISWEPFVLAVGFALLVALFFGVQPARRAARLAPAKVLQ